MYGAKPPLRRVPRLPEGPGGHPPRCGHGPGRGTQVHWGGRDPGGPQGRLHPPQRGGAEGLPFPGLRPLDGAGPERPSQAGGGGAALCRFCLLRGESGGGAPDPAIPLRGAEAPARRSSRPGGGRRRGGPLPLPAAGQAGERRGAGGPAGEKEAEPGEFERPAGAERGPALPGPGPDLRRDGGGRGPGACGGTGETLDKNAACAHNRAHEEVPARVRL